MYFPIKTSRSLQAKHYTLLRWIAIVVLFFSCGNASWAQITFRAEAPQSVALSEQIRVRFVLRNADASDFKAPEVEGLSTLFPPQNAISQANLNGKISTTFTGTYLAESVGTVRIGSASVRANGKVYKSQPITIKVLPAEKGGKQQTVNSSTTIFIRSIPSKTTAYEQEDILVTYKIYTRSSRIDFEQVKFPEYDGFIEQEIEGANTGQLTMEHYNGKNYYTAILRQSIITPQRSGKLAIPQGEFNLRMAVEASISDEEEFFGMTAIPTVSKKVLSAPLSLQIKDLPSPKPEGFDGAVGRFTLQAEIINPQEIKTNDALTLKLTISGQGNLKLLSPPQVAFPESFEVFDPKSETNIEATQNGIKGTRTIEYYAVPRNVGQFEIPAISMSYFDPSDEQYHYATTSSFTVNVQKGDNTSLYEGNVKSDVELLSNDIAYLFPYSQRQPLFKFLFGPFYWLLYLLILIITIVGGMLYRRYRRSLNDVVGSKYRKAGKMISNQLAAAEALLQTGQESEKFYTVLLSAMYKYLGDKLTIGNSQMDKSYLQKALVQIGVSTGVIESLFSVISEIEYARFAPNSSGTAQQELLQKAKRVIEEIESIKKNKR